MDDILKTSIRLDPETIAMLRELARDLEGNRSMALRRAVRTDYAIRGVKPAERPATPAREVRHVSQPA